MAVEQTCDYLFNELRPIDHVLGRHRATTYFESNISHYGENRVPGDL